MGNPEKLATLGTQDTRRRQTTQKTKTMSISDLKTNRGEPRHSEGQADHASYKTLI